MKLAAKRISVAANLADEVRLPPDEFLFEWGIGKFMILFQQVELHLCSWIAYHMSIDDRDILVLLKDSNFNQKISIAGEILKRTNADKKTTKQFMKSLKSTNDFRNRVAHGIFFSDGVDLYLSMPSKDFLRVGPEYVINNNKLIGYLQNCRNIIAFLAMDRMAASTAVRTKPASAPAAPPAS